MLADTARERCRRCLESPNQTELSVFFNPQELGLSHMQTVKNTKPPQDDTILTSVIEFRAALCWIHGGRAKDICNATGSASKPFQCFEALEPTNKDAVSHSPPPKRCVNRGVKGKSIRRTGRITSTAVGSAQSVKP